MQGKLWAYKGFFLSGNLLSHSSSTVVETSGSDSGFEDFGKKVGKFLEKWEKDGFLRNFNAYVEVWLWRVDDERKREENVCLVVRVEWLRVLEREMDNIFDCVCFVH